MVGLRSYPINCSLMKSLIKDSIKIATTFYRRNYYFINRKTWRFWNVSFPCSLLACYKRYCNLRCKLSILISISSEKQASNAIDAETIRPQMNIFQAHERAPTPLSDEPDSPTGYRELPNASRRSSTCLKTGLATGRPPLDDSTATRKIYGYGQRAFLKIPVYCFHASFR